MATGKREKPGVNRLALMLSASSPDKALNNVGVSGRGQ